MMADYLITNFLASHGQTYSIICHVPTCQFWAGVPERHFLPVNLFLPNKVAFNSLVTKIQAIENGMILIDDQGKVYCAKFITYSGMLRIESAPVVELLAEEILDFFVYQDLIILVDKECQFYKNKITDFCKKTPYKKSPLLRQCDRLILSSHKTKVVNFKILAVGKFNFDSMTERIDIIFTISGSDDGKRYLGWIFMYLEPWLNERDAAPVIFFADAEEYQKNINLINQVGFFSKSHALAVLNDGGVCLIILQGNILFVSDKKTAVMSSTFLSPFLLNCAAKLVVFSDKQLYPANAFLPKTTAWGYTLRSMYSELLESNLHLAAEKHTVDSVAAPLGMKDPHAYGYGITSMGSLLQIFVSTVAGKSNIRLLRTFLPFAKTPFDLKSFWQYLSSCAPLDLVTHTRKVYDAILSDQPLSTIPEINFQALMGAYHERVHSLRDLPYVACFNVLLALCNFVQCVEKNQIAVNGMSLLQKLQYVECEFYGTLRKSVPVVGCFADSLRKKFFADKEDPNPTLFWAQLQTLFPDDVGKIRTMYVRCLSNEKKKSQSDGISASADDSYTSPEINMADLCSHIESKMRALQDNGTSMCVFVVMALLTLLKHLCDQSERSDRRLGASWQALNKAELRFYEKPELLADTVYCIPHGLAYQLKNRVFPLS